MESGQYRTDTRLPMRPLRTDGLQNHRLSRWRRDLPGMLRWRDRLRVFHTFQNMKSQSSTKPPPNPAVYKPKSAEDFIGPARRWARVIDQLVAQAGDTPIKVL